MIAGIPGAGISALFYLICVALMPFHALLRTIRDRSQAAGQWHLVARQLAIGAGILAVLLGSGYVISLIVLSPVVASGSASEIAVQVGVAVGRIGVLVTLVTLALVIGTVRVLAWADLRSRRARRLPQHGGAIARRPSASE